MQPLNLREYAEAQRRMGLAWADELLDACEAQEVVDKALTLDDQVRTVLEDHGCENRRTEYDTVHAVQKLCHRDVEIVRLIEQNDENVWYESDDPVVQLTAGIAWLRTEADTMEEIRDYLMSVGAIDGDSDILTVIKVLIG